ncbi:MAG: multicomponent Na+:H+ antiporter subunit D [Candidatus Marinamargulisbacteria bacterium]|jgi:multicomponent Na+:H+ antiporter subunit D
MISAQLPVLIVVIPLLVALFVTILGWNNQKIALPLSIAGMAGALWASVKTLFNVIETGESISYKLGNWDPPIGIEYVVDHLNGTVLVLITLVSLLTLVYSKRGIEREMGDKTVHFYTLYLLFVTGLLGITITGDAFNLYVLLEISSLSCYALIALGRGRAYMATFNYLIMGTIGACFYLLGVGYLLMKTGTLNMADLHTIISTLHDSRAILAAFIFIMVGIWIKMAFFPLHGWLPNAYTFAPITTSCVVAPLMTKVSVYMMIRMMYGVFSPEYVFGVLHWQPVVMGLSVIAIISGSLFALLQKDLKKMLTYLVIAEIGYMMGGAWLGNAMGLTGAVYHIFADSLMTLCLFMAVGCIIFKTGHGHLDKLQGVFKKMPLTMAGFLVGAFSMIGIPPTAGFFSKWYLISGAIDAGQWHFMAALLISSLVNAVLFFRIIEKAYFQNGHSEDGKTEDQPAIEEAPVSMLGPLLGVSTMVIMLGLFTQEIVTKIIVHVVPVEFL